MKRLTLISATFTALIMITYFLPYGTWKAIGSLPAHPLIVHGVVVAVPFLGLVFLFSLYKRKYFKKYHLHFIALTGLATLGVLVAKSSGDSLAAAVGLPKDHAEWGNNLVPVVMALFGVLVLYSLSDFYIKISLLTKMLKLLLVLLSIAAIALTYLVGHSGAKSVWEYKYQSALEVNTPSLSKISLAEIKEHDKISDCWTAVDGFVYDVTTFAFRHPAGSSAIVEMCGKDATEDFLDEHGGQGEPASWLESLKIGTLK